MNFSLPLPFKTSAVLASSAHIADTDVRVYSLGFCALWAVSSPLWQRNIPHHFENWGQDILGNEFYFYKYFVIFTLLYYVIWR